MSFKRNGYSKKTVKNSMGDNIGRFQRLEVNYKHVSLFPTIEVGKSMKNMLKIQVQTGSK